MKIELVYPASGANAMLRNHALAVLAGMTPKEHQITLRDDRIKPLDTDRDLDFSADIAGITVQTRNSLRGYELARAYRKKGVKVVLGGIHPTALPDEAIQHADAVVVGEAEGLWETILEDVKRGQLKKIYKHKELPVFDTAPKPRWDIFTSKKYVPMYTAQASRGCPFNCEFCSVVPFFGNKLRLRNVSDVIDELKLLKGSRLLFSDDNIVGKANYTKELLTQLISLKLSWLGQASLHGLKDPETLTLLQKSGCKGLLIGFETVNKASLKSCGKSHNNPEDYLEMVKRLADYGIGVMASFVVGLDQDTPDIFKQIFDFALESKVYNAIFSIMTPYPGTPLHERLVRENRLFNKEWWLEPQPTEYPLYRPLNMTADQLYEGEQWLWKEFYSHSSIWKRFPFAAGTSLFSLVSYLPMNYIQHGFINKRIAEEKEYYKIHPKIED